jgi:NCS2 family nucleobase:cation symporter-2
MLALGLLPKLAFIVASVPQSRWRGLHHVRHGRRNQRQDIVDGRLRQAAQQRPCAHDLDWLRPHSARLAEFPPIFPQSLKPIFGDGIILTSITAVLLNAFFNPTSPERAEADTFAQPMLPSISEASTLSGTSIV